MKTYLCGLLLSLGLTAVQAQKIKFSQPHGFCDQPFELQITPTKAVDGTIRYTLDGSEPSATSEAYTAPLTVSGTTIIRAAAIGADGALTPVATATYLFMDDVLNQSNTPAGYPDKWGKYTEISGTATADYEMDPEMTNDPVLRPKIIEGLKSLPVLSIVTDKDNLFSHENDEERGGIYIYTGPPVGDPTGKSWTRPVSAEMFGADETGEYDFSVTCGLRIHGGHGRLAEKNPKHSLRLVFKEEYGDKNIKYPLYGEDEPSKFKQIVLRCHFGNSWQHWSEGNRQYAQYTRDVWARRMQRKLGRTSVNARYVHLFLNGMYWGLYNMAERVDGQYGENHLGGDKDDMDVVKIEEEGGNHHEAAEGDLVAWDEMLKVVSKAADDAYYAKLDTLLDIDAFIDYMLINQYAGNTDWDHHNWYAIRRRGSDSQGFRFLCWDSEIIFESPTENVFKTHNAGGFPTGIFNNLIKNKQFARKYVARAKELLAPDGLLGQESVVSVWDSLYHVVQTAVYAEAARWGDYRRDVHRYQTAGQLYTVDKHYMAERNRLLTQYFPVRTSRVLNQVLEFANIDDSETGTRTINVNGTTRSYMFYVPKNLGDNRPLLISCHGMNQDAAYQKGMLTIESVADTAKFVTVFPEGIDRGWDISGDRDINFVLALIDEMVDKYHVDRNRVYLSGFSMGGMFTYHAMNRIADKIAAFAPISGYPMGGTTANASVRPIPIIHTHGTGDDVVGFGGVQGALNAWINHNHCPAQAKVETNYRGAQHITRRTWGPGDNNVEVVLMELKDKGHWISNDIVLSGDEIWKFCKRYSLELKDPTVRITSPKSGLQYVTIGGASDIEDLTLTATASDPDGTVVSVAFYNDDELLAVCTEAPYTCVVTGLTKGEHRLRAVATDDEGRTGSSVVVVSVEEPTTNYLLHNAFTVEASVPEGWSTYDGSEHRTGFSSGYSSGSRVFHFTNATRDFEWGLYTRNVTGAANVGYARFADKTTQTALTLYPGNYRLMCRVTNWNIPSFSPVKVAVETADGSEVWKTTFTPTANIGNTASNAFSGTTLETLYFDINEKGRYTLTFYTADAPWADLVVGQAALSRVGESSAVEGVTVTPTATGYYNLNGQRVEQPRKGVYINGGKKVIVK